VFAAADPRKWNIASVETGSSACNCAISHRYRPSIVNFATGEYVNDFMMQTYRAFPTTFLHTRLLAASALHVTSQIGSADDDEWLMKQQYRTHYRRSFGTCSTSGRRGHLWCRDTIITTASAPTLTAERKAQKQTFYYRLLKM